MYDSITLSNAYERPVLLGSCGRRSTYFTRRASTGEPLVVKRFQAPVWMKQTERDALLSRLAGVPAWLREPAVKGVQPLAEVWREDNSVAFLRAHAPGESLAEAIAARGAYTRAEFASIALDLGGKLDHLRRLGQSHGSVTAGNVIVGYGGELTLTDAGLRVASREFGIANVRCGTGTAGDDVSQLARLCVAALGDTCEAEIGGLLSLAAEKGRRRFSGIELADAIAPRSKSAIFQVAWKPAAALGLAGSLVTVGATGYSRQTEQETAVPRSPVAAVVAEASEPEHLLPSLAQADRDALELAMRRKGVAIFAHAVVADAFDLSEAQRAEVAAVLRKGREQTAALLERLSAGHAVNINAAMQKSREEVTAAVLAQLDEAQRERWTELQGAGLEPNEPLL